VPAGVSGIPPLSKKTVTKADYCIHKKRPVGRTISCERVVAEWRRGTGCLEECWTQLRRREVRERQFCTNGNTCNSAAPCNSSVVLMVNVPPLKNATLPPVPKGVDVNGVLSLPPDLISILVDQNTGMPCVLIEGLPSGSSRWSQTKLLRIRWLYSMRDVGSSIIVRLCTNRVTCRGCGTRPGQVSLAMQHTTKCMRQRCNHGRTECHCSGRQDLLP
jgi:hypothetical protein